MGYYVLELEKSETGIEVKCTLHHYYQATCTCGHRTKSKPLIGYISVVEGRKQDLKLQEYGLVGPIMRLNGLYDMRLLLAVLAMVLVRAKAV